MNAPEREALVTALKKAAAVFVSTGGHPKIDGSKPYILLTEASRDEIVEALSPAVTVTEGWKPIETAPKGRKIIGGYFNELGNWRSVMACYYGPKTLDANHDYIDGDEDGYAPEGWYEDGEAYSEALLPTDKPLTHWMPLPASPTPQTGSQP